MIFASLRRNSSWAVVICALILMGESRYAKAANYTADSLRAKVEMILVKRNVSDTAAGAELNDAFKAYVEKFIHLFDKFISPKDKRPRAQHLNDFNALIESFEADYVVPMCKDSRWNGVRADLMIFLQDIKGLVEVIRTAGSALELGAKLRLSYYHLLPAKNNPLDKYSLAEINTALRHRFK